MPQDGEEAVTLKPAGTDFTSSLWLPHAMNSSGRPLKRSEWSETFNSTSPNSGVSAGPTSEPKRWHINCMPAQMPRTGYSARSMYSAPLPILLPSQATFGAPPERTRPSRSFSSPKGVVFGTILVSTPRHLRTRHSRCVH